MSRKPVPAQAGDRSRVELTFDRPQLLSALFGQYDRNLVTLENRLGVYITARGNRVGLEGTAEQVALARDVLKIWVLGGSAQTLAEAPCACCKRRRPSDTLVSETVWFVKDGGGKAHLDSGRKQGLKGAKVDAYPVCKHCIREWRKDRLGCLHRE